MAIVIYLKSCWVWHDLPFKGTLTGDGVVLTSKRLEVSENFFAGGDPLPMLPPLPPPPMPLAMLGRLLFDGLVHVVGLLLPFVVKRFSMEKDEK